MVALKTLLKKEIYPDLKKQKLVKSQKTFMKCFETFKKSTDLEKKIKELKKQKKSLVCEFGEIEMNVLDKILIKIKEYKEDKKDKKKVKRKSKPKKEKKEKKEKKRKSQKKEKKEEKENNDIELCEQWEENKKNIVNGKVKNPKSNRLVKEGSKTYKDMEKKCEEVLGKNEEKIEDLIKETKYEVKEMKKDLSKDISKVRMSKSPELPSNLDTTEDEEMKYMFKQKKEPKKENKFKILLEKIKNNDMTNKEINDTLKELKLDNEKEYLKQIILLRLEQMK